ncbi:hypothetical protein B7494_g3823 [Chlorociboria aeruginascens]|nr:hypothetical protein B7494_g3823 [Chlorociboria aeruginascens]
MYFSSLPTTLLVALAVHGGVNAAGGLDDKKSPPPDPCTIASGTGSFYDLRPLSVVPPEEGKRPVKNAKIDSWHARGHDYKSNFTLNICAPVVEDIEDVVGVEKSLRKNVSAFYDYEGKTYSLGQQSSSLVLRGRRLILQYTNGSPCGGNRKREAKSKDDDDDDDDKDKAKGHKSALVLLQCEKDPLAPQATVSFLGTDPDECSYSFLINSHAACSGSEPAKQGVGPGAVFAIIGHVGGHRQFYKGKQAEFPAFETENFTSEGRFCKRWDSTYDGSEDFWEKIIEELCVEVFFGI